MNCPACHKPLSKKYRRTLNPLESAKFQGVYWMTAWLREVHNSDRIERELNGLKRKWKRRKVKASEY